LERAKEGNVRKRCQISEMPELLVCARNVVLERLGVVSVKRDLCHAPVQLAEAAVRGILAEEFLSSC
jgi:hypothetical protein